MIDHVMTHESFKKGLTLYLNDRGNGTAKDQDLIDSLVQQYKNDYSKSEVDFQDFLVSWVRQAGHPIITVKRNYTDQTVTVSQERFLLSGNSSGAKQGWWVPITYATKSNPNFTVTYPSSWLARNDSEKLVEGLNVPNDDWIIFNVQQTGE
ncbi:hypothetical protein PR048_008806 [Dryococelus australis]|uniref:Aminopeptidase N n=1 Tax=Dryococelus australis TaxID=614101 RepID=A0ABQ9HY52_9NEOP|nr:hypothetical protein PR048_008806 [Dryococelus australis]